MLKIAVVSDLHIGHGARAKDFTPFDHHTHTTEEDYLGQFKKFAQDQKITADFLIVPGDISNSAHPSEFVQADIILRSLAESLGVDTSRIIFSPGNHDIDWLVMSCYDNEAKATKDHHKFGFSRRYETIQQANKIFHEVHEKRIAGSLFKDPYFAIWHFDDTLILSINSANHDGPAEEIHHGYVSESTLNAIRSALEKCEWNSLKHRFCIVHHHPVMYQDPIPNEPDFSAMSNAESLTSLLSEFKFDVLFHGHKHNPSFTSHQKNSLHPLAILAAGSFSHHLDPRWAGRVNNQFHLLEIHGRSAESSHAFGHLKNYAYLCGHGWLKSNINNGINHVKQFGVYGNETMIQEGIEQRIMNALLGATCVYWSELCDNENRLSYIPAELRDSVLTNIARKNSLHLKSEGDEDFIMLKKKVTG